MFQSRNRDAFRFKRSQEAFFFAILASRWFQSRNRDAFRFKKLTEICDPTCTLNSTFQSRNRDAFRFKHPESQAKRLHQKFPYRFNLVIEMLFVSSIVGTGGRRDSFKVFTRFNLVIEMLFVSRNVSMNSSFNSHVISFNLVIEMLFVSRKRRRVVAIAKIALSVSIS